MTNLYGILLIALLVVVSGLIAYVGDIVGRRLGRKRLSLFGMRPRHTAIAISVLAGMVITLVTLGVAMGVSKDVKDGFLRVAEMRRAQGELSRRIKDLTERTAAMESARKDAEQRVREAKSELASTRDELDQQKEKLAAETRKLEKTSKALREAETQLKTAARILSEQWRTTEALEADIARATREAAVGRAVPILFGAEQPLDVELIQGGQPTREVRKQLDALVNRLEEKTREAGARPLPNTKNAIIIRHLMLDEDKKSVAYFSGEQVLDAIARQLHEAAGGIIVRAFSVFNTHEGEPAYVDFQLFNNLLVYERGETLAETILDGRISEPALMAALVSLLRDEVGTKAREKNVMPRLGPLGSDAIGSSRGAVGEMSYEQLFNHIEELLRIGGPARVTAVAAEETWTIGPLKVDFLIEPVMAEEAK